MPANLFNASHYRSQNPDLVNAGLVTDGQLYQHFILHGLNEGRQFAKFADLSYYSQMNPDLAAAGKTTQSSLYNHLSQNGIREGRAFSPLADIDFYLSYNPDLNQAFAGDRGTALEHLERYGVAEGRQFSNYVDLDFYLEENGDLKNVFGADREAALEHLKQSGLKEGRRFSENFDPKFYGDSNPDLVAAGVSAPESLFHHFIHHGYRERRAAVPFIEVISPSLISNVVAGALQNIRWDDNLIGNVQFELYKGDSKIQTITLSTKSDGLFEWKVPSSLQAGNDYSIYVKSNRYDYVADWSKNFSVQSNQPSKSVRLTSPNGGNQLTAGQSTILTWTDNFTEDVRIELYRGGRFAQTIVSSTPSDGQFLWTIPANITGSDYQIRVSSGTVSDLSDTYFTVKQPTVDLKKYWFYYNFNSSNYQSADSYIGSVIAPKGTYQVGQNYNPKRQNTEMGLDGQYLISREDDYNPDFSPVGIESIRLAPNGMSRLLNRAIETA